MHFALFLCLPNHLIQTLFLATFQTFAGYSQISNNSTGTIEKNPPKSLAVLSFSCGTIGKNSGFSLAVLLFEWYYNLHFNPTIFGLYIFSFYSPIHLNSSIQELTENTEIDTLWLTEGNSQTKAFTTNFENRISKQNYG